MPDVVVWVTKPSDVDVPELEMLRGEIRRLDHVSEVGFMTEQSALRVSFEGTRPSRRRSKPPSGKRVTRSSRSRASERYRQERRVRCRERAKEPGRWAG